MHTFTPHMEQAPAHRYFMLYKPYDMVSQFVSPDKVNVLGDVAFDWPEGTHAIGRLDNHSEGLLLLTTNKRVTKLLFESKEPHKRTYLVRVDRKMSPETAAALGAGVDIRIQNDEVYHTPPCEVSLTDTPDWLPPGGYELKDFIPHSWLYITLTEGKFRQVRKMVAAVGHPCKRLIRVSIEDMHIGNLQPGEVKEFIEEEFFRLLRIPYPAP